MPATPADGIDGADEADATDPADRERAAEILAEGVPAHALRTRLESLSAAQLQDGFGLTLFRRWSRFEPQSAAQWAVGLSDADARRTLVAAAAIFWTQQDLSAALAWMRTLPAEPASREFLVALAFEALNVDPVQALRLAFELRGEEGRDELAGQALGAWAARKPRDADAWLRELPAGPARDRLIATTIPACAQKEPAVAAKLAIDCLPPGPIRNQAILSSVQAWARIDPQKAAAWVGQFPSGSLQVAAVGQLVGEWRARDAVQCASWLAGLATGSFYEMAMTAFVDQFDPADPVWAPRRG